MSYYHTLCLFKLCLFLFYTDLLQGHFCYGIARFVDSTKAYTSTGLVACFRKDTWVLETSLILHVFAVHKAVHGHN